MRISRFEEIQAWQKGRELAKAVYALTRSPGFTADRSLKDQIRRAAVSIGANIAEGFERCSDRQFAQFLYNARGSAGEVRSLLYLARDQDYITAEEFDRVSALAEEVSKALFGFIRYLQPPAQE
ncbi:MAG: four helix bundle protein [Candidatus Bipolaricaulota bacterium]